MPKNILCKFYANGSCLKGEHCDYSHDSNSSLSNVCSFYQRGTCSFGSRCRYEHVKPNNIDSCASSSSSHSPKGLPSATHPKKEQRNGLKRDDAAHCLAEVCPTCGANYVEGERDSHIEKCEKKQKQAEASEEIECSVCLDKVLSKSTQAERKFGVLSECDHPFCISCIRNWRNSSSSSSGYDVSAAVKSCPICRKVSYFVIPSVLWFTTKEEKQEIVSNYKARLRSIDCKHFDFGNGNCPFGNSCFYKHTVNPGSYTWKYNRPPPRRQHLGRDDIADLFGFGDLCDLFDHMIEEEVDFFDFGDYDDGFGDFEDDYTSFAIFDSSSDDDYAF